MSISKQARLNYLYTLILKYIPKVIDILSSFFIHMISFIVYKLKRINKYKVSHLFGQLEIWHWLSGGDFQWRKFQTSIFYK